MTTEAGNTVTSDGGTVIEVSQGVFQIVDIPTSKNLIVTITNAAGCSIQQTVTAPDCSCPVLSPPTVATAQINICQGQSFPALSATVADENVTIDWYDAATGGNLLLSNSPTFTPTAAGVFYAAARNTSSGCPSNTRTSISLIVNDLPNIEVVSVTDVTCAQDFGSITVNTIGGLAPFQFSVEPNIFQSNNVFNDLPKGFYTVTVRDANGCEGQAEATIITNTRKDVQTVSQFTCNLTEIGTDTLFLINELGCDSLIITTTLDGTSRPTFITATTCDRNQARDTTVFQNRFGCDSLVITNYTFTPADTTLLTATTCDPLEVGQQTNLFRNRLGCDSLVITNVLLIPADTTFLEATSCDPNAVGSTTRLLQNRAGCDSLIIINTIFADRDQILLTQTTCDPTRVGIDTLKFINRLGCDSLIITQTTLRGTPDTVQLERITCDFDQVGERTFVFQNAVGCDSVVIVNTIFDFPVAPRVNISSRAPICEGDEVTLSVLNYTEGLQWLRNGNIISGANEVQFKATENGTYAVTYTNSDGCSVVSISFEVSVIPAPFEPFFSNVNNLLTLQKPQGFSGLTLQWFLDGIAIEGANDITYCAQVSGTYTLTVTDPTTGCSATHVMEVIHNPAIENCNLVNTHQIIFETTPKVYPNPTSDLIFLDFELTEPSEVSIQMIDLLGRVQQTTHYGSLQGKVNTTLSVPALADGIYYLRLEANHKVWLTKVIKQH